MKELLSCAALSAHVRACPIPNTVYWTSLGDEAKSVSRTAREVNLSTRAARERLKPSGKPYYRSLDQGLHLGYRKGVRGAAWVMRWYVGAETYKVESLEGQPDDVLEADGATALTWSQAQAEARKLFGRREREAAGLEADQLRAIQGSRRDRRLPQLACRSSEDKPRLEIPC